MKPARLITESMLRVAVKALREIKNEKGLGDVADSWMRWRAASTLRELGRMKRQARKR